MDYAVAHPHLTSASSILGLALLIAGCRQEPPRADAGLDEALEATFAGCGAVVVQGKGVVCELREPRRVRLVLPGTGSATVYSIDSKGRPLPTGSSEPRPHHYDVTVPAEAEGIVARVTDDRRSAQFTLAVRTAHTLAWLEEAKALRARGDLSRAREIAEAHVDANERDQARDLLARITLAEGHAEQSFPLFREAIAAHRAAGRVSDAVDDSFALAFALHQRSHRYQEARATLDALTPELALYPEGRAREPYYRGILASETGDHRTAVRQLEEAQARAGTLGMARLERNTRAALALEMLALGRAREALTLLRALDRDADVRSCERVEIANDLGWTALLLEDGAAPREEARAPLERALAVTDCGDAYLTSFAHGNLARVALAEGDLARARQHLDAARGSVKEPRETERLAWLDLDGRILLAQGKPMEARRHFETELALARAGLALDAEWNALLGLAAARTDEHRPRDAASALLAAEDVVDRAALLVPLGEGRGTFLEGRSRSAREAVEILVTLGRLEDAARVAARSRTRTLASVERALRIESLPSAGRQTWENAVGGYRAARAALDAEAAADWTLPADALARVTAARQAQERALRQTLEVALSAQGVVTEVPASDDRPAPEDLEIVIHPGKSGWLAITRDHDHATSARVPAPDRPGDELAAALLVPLATRLATARRVRVRAYGAWRQVDVHALPFDGAPLLAAVAVDYPLGLRARHPPDDGQRRALVVGDPTGDLPAARSEATAVARRLEGRMPTRLLLGREASSRAANAGLASATLFHYAGHGIFAGPEGWESSLPIAEGGRLTIADLLALPHAPRRVILSGCDAARNAGGAEGLGLGQALLAAGADEVFAPTRPVTDALAARVAEALYADDAAADTAASFATAVRMALARVRSADPSLDWAAYRLLTP